MPLQHHDEWDIDQVADITGRWARASAKDFPLWEVNEIHSEAFLIAVSLLDKGRYDSSRAALSTFLWHALPLDVRHRYRRANGQRYVTDSDGKRRYKRVEIIGNPNAELIESSDAADEWDGVVKSFDMQSEDSHWLSARLRGYTASELRARGMSYAEQRQSAERFREQRKDEQ